MPTGYQGYSSTDYARSMSTTLARHLRDEEETWMRNFQILSLLLQNGKVEFNCGGRGIDWPVRYKRANIEGNTGETPRNFPRVNRHLLAFLPYRGYQATDSIYEKEMLENRGPEAIVKTFERMTKNLEEDMKAGLATEMYVDGSTAGNATSWMGFETMFAITGTVNISTGATRAANAADYVGYPDDTYAGLTTELGDYGGEQESGAIWPNGVADPEYDHWSPLVLNSKSTAYAASTHTWAGQGDEVMRLGIIMSQRNATMDGQITNIMLARMYYNDMLNLLKTKEQINVTSQTELRALGFKNTFLFDGVEVSWEAGVPTSTGYGFNWNMIELKCMHDTFLKANDLEYDIDSNSWKTCVSTLSNLKFHSPRGFFKIAELT